MAKKGKFKKILAVILTIVMTMSMVNISAFAEDGESNETVPTCGKEEHTHTDTCYTTEEKLICGQDENVGHTHGDECYDDEGNLLCELEESEGHTHSDECYTSSQTLICTLEEHAHNEECYTQNETQGIPSDPKANNNSNTDNSNPQKDLDSPAEISTPETSTEAVCNPVYRYFRLDFNVTGHSDEAGNIRVNLPDGDFPDITIKGQITVPEEIVNSLKPTNSTVDFTLHPEDAVEKSDSGQNRWLTFAIDLTSVRREALEKISQKMITIIQILILSSVI